MSAVHFKMHPKDLPLSAVGKNPPTNVGDIGLTPGPGISHMQWDN